MKEKKKNLKKNLLNKISKCVHEIDPTWPQVTTCGLTVHHLLSGRKTDKPVTCKRCRGIMTVRGDFK